MTKKEKLALSKGISNIELIQCRKEKALFIGIDPGTNTGVAVWKSKSRRFHSIFTMSILDAMEYVYGLYGSAIFEEETSVLIIEDARKKRLPKHLQSGSSRLMGAGSIRRDCKMWVDFCVSKSLRFYLKPPVSSLTGWNAKKFQEYTGYEHQTNQHGRDAAMLVYDL